MVIFNILIICADIEKMNMWPTIQSLLTSPTSTDNMRAAVLWIIGTAVQNNPAAQNAVSYNVVGNVIGSANLALCLVSFSARFSTRLYPFVHIAD